MANLVADFKARGVPIDGIGLESHFILGEVPTTLQANMEAFTALGVEVAITELDIRMMLPVTQAMLEQQQSDFETVISACTAVADCVGVSCFFHSSEFVEVIRLFFAPFSRRSRSGNSMFAY